MHAVKGAIEVLDQPAKRQVKRRAPANQHIVISGAHPVGRRKSHDLFESPADPVADDRVADLSGNGKTHAHRAILAPIKRLQQKACGGNLGASCCGQEISAMPEPLHGGRVTRARFRR
jgi:hypothetical protein